MDLLPSYLMVRTTGRSAMTKRTLQPDVVELVGVPEDGEVTAQDVFVELVALLGDDQRAHRVLGDAPRAPELDGLDNVLGRRSGRGGTRSGRLRWDRGLLQLGLLLGRRRRLRLRNG